MSLQQACLGCGLIVLMVTSLSAQDEKLWCQYVGKSGAGLGKQIVLISGDDEYRSEEALPMLGKILAVHHGFRCTVLFPVNEEGIVQPNYQNNIPGLEALKSADLVIMGLRFRNLPDEQMELIDQYLESGKPIIGIRTSTHAFRVPKDRKYHRYTFNHGAGEWQGGFGQRVFGDTWVNHHGKHGKESTRGVINEEFARHPILRGIDDVWGPTDVYGIKRLGESAKILMHGQILKGMKPGDEAVEGNRNDPMMPLVWTKNYKTQSGKESKVFCTTMGAATDFESEDLRRLLVNASYWAVGLETEIKPDLNIEYVDSYSPTNFGFGNFQKDRKPSFYELKAKTK